MGRGCATIPACRSSISNSRKSGQSPVRSRESDPAKSISRYSGYDLVPHCRSCQPGASDPETRLRILTVRGILQTNQDAAQAHATWEEVEKLARKLHHYELATRAIGEQGIAAFILGDALTAKKQVVFAWTLR